MELFALTNIVFASPGDNEIIIFIKCRIQYLANARILDFGQGPGEIAAEIPIRFFQGGEKRIDGGRARRPNDTAAVSRTFRKRSFKAERRGATARAS